MRKKIALAFATVFAVAAVGTTVASANGPTIVDEGFPCFVFDGNGQLFVTTNSVVTLYDSGKVVLKCNGNGAGAPGVDVLQLRQHRRALQHPGVRPDERLEQQGRLQRQLAAHLHDLRSGHRRPRPGERVGRERQESVSKGFARVRRA